MRKTVLVICLVLAAATGIFARQVATQDSKEIKDQLFAAAGDGDFTTVRDLLEQYPDMINSAIPGGWTLLHLAYNSRELVEYLLEHGADIEARSGGGWTPLHNQAYKGELDAVALLLEHGADIEARTAFGHTPLLSSIRWDRTEVTKFLIEKGANVDAATDLGRTALITGSVEGNREMVQLFLDAGADLSIRDNNYNRTALHFAALYGQLEIVAALAEKDANVNEKDAAGKTPLDYANRYGHEKVAKLLKSSGAEGEIDPEHFGFSAYLTKELGAGEAYAWYMGHAGYAIKTANHLLLFNYSYGSGAGQPAEPRLANGRVNLDEIADCRTIVFAGSPHHAHHHPEGFRRWQETHKDITFVYSFRDTLGRNPGYFKDVEGPEYTYLPDGETTTIQGVKVETIPVKGFGPPGSGFLVEADGLVIFYGGNHLFADESWREAFRKPFDTLVERGIDIDILILRGNFAMGRISSDNLEGVEYAVKTLEPGAFLASGGDSTEFVLREVAAALEKYNNHTMIFCPEHRGDRIYLKM
jgi:ankyrin repeat protein